MIQSVAARLEHYMDLLSVRQKLSASNLANMDTPGYHTKDIDFQSEFKKAMETGMEPAIFEVAGLTVKNDGSNVSLDRETRLLSENALRFNLASGLARTELKQIRLALEEGRTS